MAVTSVAVSLPRRSRFVPRQSAAISDKPHSLDTATEASIYGSGGGAPRELPLLAGASQSTIHHSRAGGTSVASCYNSTHLPGLSLVYDGGARVRAHGSAMNLYFHHIAR